MPDSPDLPISQPSAQETEGTTSFKLHYGLSRRVIGNATKELLTGINDKPEWLTPQEIINVCGFLSQLGYYLSHSSVIDQGERIVLSVPQASITKSKEDTVNFEMPASDFYSQLGNGIKKHIDSELANLSDEKRSRIDPKDYLMHKVEIARALDFLSEQTDHVVQPTMEYHGDFDNPAYSIQKLDVK